jgi:enoyl-CoA hydratase/carnithine racemase
MTQLSEYADRYQNLRMTRHDGVLEVTMHTDGGSLLWSEPAHREFPDAFADIGRDPDTKVVILTGSGPDFCPGVDWQSWKDRISARSRDKLYSEGKRLLRNLLAIEVPIVTAVNGRAHQHSELAVMGDIVIAAEDASFKDPHFSHGRVPGDGVHVVWPLLIGLNRAKYFHLTGQVIEAQEAKTLGAVNEVVPREQLLPRARILAADLASKPELLRRYSRVALNLTLSRNLEMDLSHGMLLEGLAAVDDHFRELENDDA